MQKFFAVVAVTLLSFFSLPIGGLTGYSVDTGLQGLYLPVVEQKLDNSLFQREFSLSFNQSQYSIFDELVVGLVSLLHLDIFIILALMELVSRFLFFFGVFLILKYLDTSERFSILSLVLVAGFVTEYQVTLPVSIAQGMAIFATSIFLTNKKSILPPILWGLCLMIHPITAVTFLFFFYLCLVINYKDTDVRTVISALVPFCFLFLYFSFVEKGPSLFLKIDEVWSSVVTHHSGYLGNSILDTFFHPINSYSVSFYLAVYLIVFFILYKKEILNRNILILLSVYPIFVIFDYVGSHLIHSAFIAQLQLHRSFFVWQLFSIILLIKFYDVTLVEKRDIFYRFLLLGVILSFSFVTPIIYDLTILSFFLFFFLLRQIIDKISGILIGSYFCSCLFLYIQASKVVFLVFAISIPVVFILSFVTIPKISITIPIIIGLYVFINSIYPIQSESFRELCSWILENTKTNQLFLTEPFYVSDRETITLHCNRSVFYTKQSGDQVIFDRNYALEWVKREGIIERLKNNPARVDLIIKEYSLDYILSDNPLNVPYTLVFSNKRFYLYNTVYAKN